MLIGDVRYETEGESAILVTISEDLNIIITASPAESAKYVDIPLNNVQAVVLDQRLSTQSQTPTYVLVVTLGKDPENRYYINAASRNDQTIALAFMSENDAKTVRRILQYRISTRRKLIEPSQSEGIDVSAPLSDDELGHAPSTISQELRETPRRATTVVARDPPNATVKPVATATTTIIQGLQAKDDEDSKWIESEVSMALKDIEFSESDEDGAEAHEAAASVRPVLLNTSIRGGGLNNVHTSDTGPQSSSQVRTGPTKMQQERNLENPPNEENDYDSSYETSPEASKALRKQSSVAIPPNLTQSLSTLAGVSVNGDVATATSNGHVLKLSKRLQNGDGEAESDIERISSRTEKSNTEGKSTKSTKSIKGNANVPRKAKGRIQKALKPPEKAAISKGKEKALAEQLDSDHYDATHPDPIDRPKATKASTEGTSKALRREQKTVIEAQPKQSSDALPEHSARPTKPKEKARADDESIWDLSLVLSDDDSGKRPQQPTTTKGANKQLAWPEEAGKGRKAQNQSKKSKSQPKKAPVLSKKAQNQVSAKPAPKHRLAPVALTQPRLRREAARKANKRIQGVDESDDIVDDDEEELVTKRKAKPLAAAATHPHTSNPSKSSNILLTTRVDKDHTLHTLPDTKHDYGAHAEDTSTHETLTSSKAQPIRGLVPDSCTDASSPEKIDLISESRNNDGLGLALPAESGEPLAEPEESQKQEAPANGPSLSGDDVTTGQNNANASEHAFVPDSVPNVQVAPSKPEDRDIIDALMEDIDDPEPIAMVGETEGSHFQEALPYPDDGITHLEDEAFSQEEPEAAPPAVGKTQPRVTNKDHKKVFKIPPQEINAASKATTMTSSARPSRAGQDEPKVVPPTTEKIQPLVTTIGRYEKVKHHDQATTVVPAKTIITILTAPPSGAGGNEPKGAPVTTRQNQPTIQTKGNHKEVESHIQDMISAPAKADTSHSATQLPKSKDPFGDKLSILAENMKGAGEERRETYHAPKVPLPKVQKTLRAKAPGVAKPTPAKKGRRLGQTENSSGSKVQNNIKHASTGQEAPQQPRRMLLEKEQELPEEVAAGPKPRLPKLQKIPEDIQGHQGPSKASKASAYTINEAKPLGEMNEMPKKSQPKTHKVDRTVRQQYEVMNLDTPIASRPVNDGERKATQDPHAKRQKRELVAPKAVMTASTGAKSQQENTPLPEVFRKAPMISFGASGPRNQGTVSNERSRRPKLSNAMQNNETKEMIAQKNPAPKRKFAPYVDDPAPWDLEQLAKRRKQDFGTTPAIHKHVPRMLAEPSPEIIQAKAHRPSSQNTRVMENGSPMPFVLSRNDGQTALVIFPEDGEVEDAFQQAHLDDDDGQIMQNDWEDPTLPLTQNVSITEGIDLILREISSNPKQLPSSPHAPSAFGTMPVHHIYHNGAIVNAQTKEPIVPTDPSDPFTSASQNPPGSFMALLRKSSDMEARRQSDQTDKQRTTAGLKRRSNAFGEDPDKTLVESAPPPKKRKILYPISKTVFSSESSSPKDTFSSSRPPSQESEVETAEHWRKAFEPHQSNMIEVLSHITHVRIKSISAKGSH